MRHGSGECRKRATARRLFSLRYVVDRKYPPRVDQYSHLDLAAMRTYQSFDEGNARRSARKM